MNISAKRFSGTWFFLSGLVFGIVVIASILAVPLGKNLDESKLRAIQTDYPADTFFLLAVSFNEGPRFIVIDGPLRVGEEVAVPALSGPMSNLRFVSRRAPFLILVRGELSVQSVAVDRLSGEDAQEPLRVIDCRDWWMVAPERPLRVLDFVLYPAPGPDR